ncbi:hypothetical protein [Gracilibacillus suaedae]|uniref:hypothetical protein n=1 Tax=Gracilibacillus suaedae TaxID=2820273 RepID=UPI001ABEB3D8|nr:hypothetical protein [Gracilibacillus suaedae]
MSLALVISGIVAIIISIVLGLMNGTFFGLLFSLIGGVLSAMIFFALSHIMDKQENILFQLQQQNKFMNQLYKTNEKCPNCNNEFDHTLKSCPNCGYRK